jgi:monodehydroascorbate reductase (NADH)
MAATDYKYVVLGGGQAAGYIAREFVSNGLSAGELAIVSSEDVVSYERPALSKAYLLPDGPRLPGFHTCVGGGGEKQPPEWYKEKGIDFKTGTTVTEVDAKAKQLKTQSGDTIGYEKLVVATGSKTISMADFGAEGADLEGIVALRDVADADKLVSLISSTKEAGGKVVMVGGGYIGMEVSSGLNQNGLDVTMVFPEPWMMPRLFTEEIAGFYEDFLAGKGITLVKGNTAKAFKGENGRVTTTVLDDGRELESALVVVGVGARPNTQLLQGQVDVEDQKPGGIPVNSRLQTSNPDVYAVGDIALFPQPRFGGEKARQEHVQHARESGAYVARELLGKQQPEYDYLPYFYSRIYDLGWEFYGEQKGDTIFFGDKSTKKFGTYWVDNDTVVAGFIEGGTKEEKAAMKKLAEVRPKSPGNSELKEQGAKFALSL